MEFVLAVALAISLFVAFSALMARGIERDRALRLSDELLALRKATPAAPVPPSAPAEEPEPERERAPRPGRAAMQETRERLEHALAEARRIASSEPATVPPIRSHETERLLGLARTLEALLAGLAHRPHEEAIEATARKPTPPPVPLPVEAARAASEEMLEELRHLGEDLVILERKEERRRSAAGMLSGALARSERLAAALTTFHATLSGLGDRVNLLALNAAVLGARSGAEGAIFQEAERELRVVYAELRRAGGELGAWAQRSADAARGAREVAADIVGRTTGSGEALTAPSERLRRAEEKGQGLERNLIALRTAVLAAEERGHLLVQAIESAQLETHRLRESLARRREEETRAAAEWVRASELSARIAETVAARPAAPAPAQPASLGPLLLRLEESVAALGRLDSPEQPEQTDSDAAVA